MYFVLRKLTTYAKVAVGLDFVLYTKYSIFGKHSRNQFR